MYTREESFNGLPRPLRADIQLWVHLVRTYIEFDYFNSIAAIEKENLDGNILLITLTENCFLKLLGEWPQALSDIPVAGLSGFYGRQPVEFLSDVSRMGMFKSLKQKPRNFTEAFIFFVFCILLLFTFYFQNFPASSPSQTPILSDFPGQQPSLPYRLLCILWHPESLSQWRVKLFSSHLLFFGYEERSYLRLYANSLLLTYAIREAHFHSLAFIFMPAESIYLLEK